MKGLKVVGLLLFILFTAYIGVERYKTQQAINELQYRNDQLQLQNDMLRYRIKHPFKR